MTTDDLDPRRPEVQFLDREMERCSRSFASARVARDTEGMELVRARFLDLEVQVREAEENY